MPQPFYRVDLRILFHDPSHAKSMKNSSRPTRGLILLAGLFWLATLLLAAPTFALQPQGTTPSATPQPPDETLPPPPTERAPSTDAERIAALQTMIKEDEQRLRQLRTELEKLDQEFEPASRDFNRLEKSATEKKQQVDKSTPADSPADIDKWKTELSALEASRKAAQDVFDLIIQRRKTTQAQILTLEEKIKLQKEELDRLKGVEPRPKTKPSQSKPTEDAPAAEPAKPKPVDMLLEALPFTKSATPKEPRPASEQAAPEQPPAETPEVRTTDPRVIAARKEFEAKREKLQESEQRVERVDRSLDILEKDIANEQQALENAEKQAKLSAENLGRQRSQLEQQQTANAPEAELEATQRQIDQAESELTKAQDAAETHAQRIEALKAQRTTFESEKEDALEELRAAEAEAEAAERWLRWMESPFAPHKVVDWLLTTGPKILVVLAILFGFWWLLRFVGRRAIRGLTLRSRSGTIEEREERAQTLISVLNSGTTIAILVIGLLAILDQAGVDVTVLMGGAAALGVAIGFGAQSLMKDYFYGAMILAENQYRVGNIVRIAGVSGMVENITLRITVLRDLEGVVHFIPHSQITTVSNLTHGWSRALFDIGVAYKEDVNRVMQVLVQLGRELREDENFQDLILEDPEMLGVDKFEDSAVVIRFYIKTRPLKQWAVRRELMRRIKNRFDELGIEIPFPHRTVFHRDLPSGGGLPE